MPQATLSSSPTPMLSFTSFPYELITIVLDMCDTDIILRSLLASKETECLIRSCTQRLTFIYGHLFNEPFRHIRQAPAFESLRYLTFMVDINHLVDWHFHKSPTFASILSNIKELVMPVRTFMVLGHYMPKLAFEKLETLRLEGSFCSVYDHDYSLSEVEKYYSFRLNTPIVAPLLRFVYLKEVTMTDCILFMNNLRHSCKIDIKLPRFRVLHPNDFTNQMEGNGFKYQCPRFVDSQTGTPAFTSSPSHKFSPRYGHIITLEDCCNLVSENPKQDSYIVTDTLNMDGITTVDGLYFTMELNGPVLATFINAYGLTLHISIHTESLIEVSADKLKLYAAIRAMRITIGDTQEIPQVVKHMVDPKTIREISILGPRMPHDVEYLETFENADVLTLGFDIPLTQGLKKLRTIVVRAGDHAEIRSLLDSVIHSTIQKIVVLRYNWCKEGNEFFCVKLHFDAKFRKEPLVIYHSAVLMSFYKSSDDVVRRVSEVISFILPSGVSIANIESYHEVVKETFIVR